MGGYRVGMKQLALVLAVGWGGGVASAAVDTAYTNWPATPEWVSTSNSLMNCYSGIVKRCYAAGMKTNGFDPPSFTCPMADYIRFAAKTEELIPYFMRSTNAVEGRRMDAGFMWSVTGMLASCGITNSMGQTNWMTSPIITSWEAVPHSIQTQLVSVLNQLQWTCIESQYTGALAKVAFNGSIGLDLYNPVTLTTVVSNYPGVAWSASAGAASISAASIDTHDDVWLVVCGRRKSKYGIGNLTDKIAHEAVLYLRPTGTKTLAHDIGCGFSAMDSSYQNETMAGSGYSYAKSRSPSHETVGYIASSLAETCPLQFPTPSAYMPSPSGAACLGLQLSGYWVLKWDLPFIEMPKAYTHAVPDVDWDGIVDCGAGVEALGPDTGTASYRSDLDTPLLVIPLASTPPWYGGVRCHAALLQGGQTNLPFYYMIPGSVDADGFYQTLNLSTRVLQSGQSTNAICVSNKLASVFRPSGHVVVFNFAYDPARKQFSPLGTPVGINALQGYVLRDPTPGCSTDLVYTLSFASGVTHMFGPAGAITNISLPDGRCAAVTTNSLPGASIGYTASLESGMSAVVTGGNDAKYNTALTWKAGRLTQAVYAARSSHPTTIAVSMAYASGSAEGRIAALEKTGFNDVADFNVAISGETLTRGEGASGWAQVTRQRKQAEGGGYTLTYVTTLADGPAGVQTLKEREEYDAHGRMLARSVIPNGNSAYQAQVTFDYPAVSTNRYANGGPASLCPVSITDAGGVVRQRVYEPETGWLASESVDCGNGKTRVTRYDYRAGTGGDPASASNLVERPREVAVEYDGQCISRQQYQYTGASRVVMRQFSTPSTSAVFTNDYCTTNNLTYGRLLAAASDRAESYVYTVSGVNAAGQFVSTGGLAVVHTVAGNPAIQTTVVNHFGNVIDSQVVEAGRVVQSMKTEQGDYLGMPVMYAYIDGSRVWCEATWSIHGWKDEARSGASRSPCASYDYDGSGQLRTARDEVANTTLTYAYDAMGNVIKTVCDGGDTVETGAEYDGAGSVRKRTDALGTTTFTCAKTSYGTRVTALQTPSGTEVATEYYRDGTVKSVDGTGVASPEEYEYSADDGKLRVKTRASGCGSEWVRSTYNMAGKSTDWNSSVAGSDAVIGRDTFGNYTGRTSSPGATTVSTFSPALGRVTQSGMDMNGNGVLDAAGTDRMQTYVRSVGADGVTHQVSSYDTGGSAAETRTSSTTTSFDGKTTRLEVNGRTTLIERGPLQNGAGDLTVTRPDGSRTKQHYQDGRLIYEVGVGTDGTAGRTTGFTYDRLGQIETVIGSDGVGVSIIRDSAQRIVQILTSGSGASLCTLSYYPGTTRVMSRTGSPTTRYDYFPNGLLKRLYDGNEYDTSYGYDSRGRVQSVTRTSGSKTQTTSWEYDPASGRPARKKIGAYVVEEYTHDAQGTLVSVRDGTGRTHTFVRNNQGDLIAEKWSDGTTPDLVYTNVDRKGRCGMKVQGGMTQACSYAADGWVTCITNSGYRAPAYSVSYRQDVNGVATGRTLKLGGNERDLAFAYDAWWRLASVSTTPVRVVYTGSVHSDTVTGQVVFCAGRPVLTRSTQWDSTNARVEQMAFVVGGRTNRLAYTYDSYSHKLTRQNLPDGSYWTYTYDGQGQLSVARRYGTNGVTVPGLSFGYEYDGVGNTTGAGGLGTARTPLHRFECADANVHVRRVWSNRVEVVGECAEGTNVVVTVNGQPCVRSGKQFYGELTVDNTGGAIWTNIIISAASNGPAGDVVAAVTGSLYVARSDEVPTYADTDRPVTDSRYRYAFDAMGRLTNVVADKAVPPLRVDFSYYPDGQRATKDVYELYGSTWSNKASHQFIWDGWTLAGEVVSRRPDSGAGRSAWTNVYVWGLDLAGQRSRQPGTQAGGIGGLVSIIRSEGAVTNVYFPAADYNGNIFAVYDTNGTEVASYTYSPFGVLVGQTGSSPDLCPLRFQSKYYDAELEAYYFGYRYFNPNSTKWLTRDPLGEEGGLNLTAFCRNDPVNAVDALGLAGYFFDGTGNDKDEFDEYGLPEDPTSDSAPTHVAALLWMYTDKGFYVNGVGTRTDIKNGMLFGVGARQRLDSMFQKFEGAYNAGDKNIDIFGFSRGAAMAREFANMVHDKYPEAKIRFLGIFDTVAQFGAPDDANNNPGIRLNLPVDSIGFTAHAVATGEKRCLFPLTSMAGSYGIDAYGGKQWGTRLMLIPWRVPRKYAASEYRTLQGDDFWEQPVEGVHSEIGGGYRNGSNLDALKWMYENAVVNEVPVDWYAEEFQKKQCFKMLEPGQSHDSRYSMLDRVPHTGMGRYTRRIYGD